MRDPLGVLRTGVLGLLVIVVLAELGWLAGVLAKQLETDLTLEQRGLWLLGGVGGALLGVVVIAGLAMLMARLPGEEESRPSGPAAPEEYEPPPEEADQPPEQGDQPSEESERPPDEG